MPNPWFRMYSEFEDDPKVQMMDEPMQRRLAMLFCERCKCEHRTDAQRAFKWRISLADLSATKALFMEQEFIDDEWNLLNWNKRQFLSDSSTDRVRKHRAKQELKQDETLHETVHAVTVTAPDTETDTETEKNIHAVALPEWLPIEAWEGWLEVRKNLKKNGRKISWTKRCAEIALGRLEKWKAAGYDLVQILDAATLNNWQGLYIPQGLQPTKPKKQWRTGDRNNPADWEAARIFPEVEP